MADEKAIADIPARVPYRKEVFVADTPLLPAFTQRQKRRIFWHWGVISGGLVL